MILENPRDFFVIEKNRLLFDELDSKYQIQLMFHNAPYNDGFSPWQLTINRQQKTAIIRYYEKVSTTGYFTHELYHIKLVENGFLTTDELLIALKEKKLTNYSLNELNNIIAHPKFYNDFINLNYLPSEFFCDFDKDYTNFINNAVQIIEESFSEESYNDTAINSFLAIYFVSIFCKNSKFLKKSVDDLDYLKRIDQQLFEIISSHWTKWINSDSLDNLQFFTLLFENIQEWKLNKINLTKL